MEKGSKKIQFRGNIRLPKRTATSRTTCFQSRHRGTGRPVFPTGNTSRLKFASHFEIRIPRLAFLPPNPTKSEYKNKIFNLLPASCLPAVPPRRGYGGRTGRSNLCSAAETRDSTLKVAPIPQLRPSQLLIPQPSQNRAKLFHPIRGGVAVPAFRIQVRPAANSTPIHLSKNPSIPSAQSCPVVPGRGQIKFF